MIRTGLARILGPHVPEDDQRRGDVFELFAAVLADGLADLAAVGAGKLSGGTACRTVLRGKLAGKGLRP